VVGRPAESKDLWLLFANLPILSRSQPAAAGLRSQVTEHKTPPLIQTASEAVLLPLLNETTIGKDATDRFERLFEKVNKALC
jgi:hypothetical protein